MAASVAEAVVRQSDPVNPGPVASRDRAFLLLAFRYRDVMTCQTDPVTR